MAAPPPLVQWPTGVGKRSRGPCNTNCPCPSRSGASYAGPTSCRRRISQPWVDRSETSRCLTTIAPSTSRKGAQGAASREPAPIAEQDRPGIWHRRVQGRWEGRLPGPTGGRRGVLLLLGCCSVFERGVRCAEPSASPFHPALGAPAPHLTRKSRQRELLRTLISVLVCSGDQGWPRIERARAGHHGRIQRSWRDRGLRMTRWTKTGTQLGTSAVGGTLLRDTGFDWPCSPIAGSTTPKSNAPWNSSTSAMSSPARSWPPTPAMDCRRWDRPSARGPHEEDMAGNDS